MAQPKGLIRAVVVLVLVGIAAVGVRALLRGDEGGPRVQATMTVAEAMGGDTTGYLRAIEPRRFSFPEDHGPHHGYRHEWWYFTGNLETAEGRRFGYQLTFFRSALTAEPEDRESAWGASDAYMAHFALTDAAGNRFYAFDRFARDAVGLAGARAEPFLVHVEDWEAKAVGMTAFPARLRAADGEVAIDLVVDQGKAPVLQGDDGLSRKGPEVGNASYYYSLTRMPTEGTIRVGGREYHVRGTSWMDREWGTSALGPEQVGWDWFSLQLSDGSELVFFELRRSDGTRDPHDYAAVVAPDGSKRNLAAGAVRLEVLDTWASPLDGIRYPSRWRVLIPDERIDLIVTPVLADQELDVAVRYWEGAVDVTGESAGHPVTGRGYVELTGYGDEPEGPRR